MLKKSVLRFTVLIFIIGVLLWCLNPVMTKSTHLFAVDVRLFIVNQSSTPKVSLQGVHVDGEDKGIKIGELARKRFLSSDWPSIQIRENQSSIQLEIKPEGKGSQKHTCKLEIGDDFTSGMLYIEYRDEGLKCGGFITEEQFRAGGASS